jgi:hypothetical protein
VVWVVYGYFRKYAKNNIFVIYEIKSFYVTLAVGKVFLNNIHRANYHLTYSKKLKKPDNTTIPLLGGIVYRKRPLPDCLNSEEDTRNIEVWP